MFKGRCIADLVGDCLTQQYPSRYRASRYRRQSLLLCDTRPIGLLERVLLDSLSRMPFIDTAELVGVLGEAHATVHRALTGLLADGIAGRVSHGTAHLPSSQRYYLTANGIGEAAGCPRICGSLGLRTRLPHFQGVVGATYPPGGRGGFRLPPRRLARGGVP